MALHLARITAIILVILACSFLPFLPGGYDGLAVTLSAMAQMFGIAGLLLVSIGALWLIYEFRRRTSTPVGTYYFAIASLFAASLAALWPDYKPGVIGVERYHYEPYGNAYNLYFEQCAVPFGTREIVMYNKLDEHHFPSHAMDILRWTPEQ